VKGIEKYRLKLSNRSETIETWVLEGRVIVFPLYFWKRIKSKQEGNNIENNNIKFEIKIILNVRSSILNTLE
jgi:hypothetical protein